MNKDLESLQENFHLLREEQRVGKEELKEQIKIFIDFRRKHR